MKSIIKYIQIQGSSLCDGKCKICPYSHSPVAKLKLTMSISQFRSILEKIYDYVKNPLLFCPYLMSDPIYDKYLIERIPIIHEFFPNTLLEISTAMSARNTEYYKELIDALSEHKNVRFIISLLGINEETYKRLATRNFERILNRTIEFLRLADGKIPEIRIVGFGGSRDRRIKLFSRKQFINFVYELIKKADMKHFKSVRAYFNTFHDRAGLVQWSNKLQIYRDINIFSPHFCCRPYEWLHVLSDGRVISCCMNYELNQIWGDLFKQSLAEIWEGEKRKLYILKQLGFQKGEIPCKYCMSPGG